MQNNLRTKFKSKVLSLGMDLSEIDALSLSLPQTELTTPFDPTTLVYKVAGKMFLMIDLDNPVVIAVKCQPERAELLRERYCEITPAYHMNHRHWNNIRLDGDLPKELICDEIRRSYRLVVDKLPSSVRASLAAHAPND